MTHLAVIKAAMVKAPMMITPPMPRRMSSGLHCPGFLLVLFLGFCRSSSSYIPAYPSLNVVYVWNCIICRVKIKQTLFSLKYVPGRKDPGNP